MRYHKHHIVPKHMGGSNNPSNIVLLTVEEHALAHKKLWEELGHWQDELAWKTLSGQITLDESKLIAIEKGLQKACETNRNRIWTEEQKEKLRGPRGTYPKRKPMPPRPPEVKDKIRQTLLGKKHPPERVEANRLGQLKRYRTL